MIIDLYEQYGVDLCRETSVREALSAIRAYDLTTVTLNFRRCAVDYPATGMITDALIKRFEQLGRPPQITYIYDIQLTESHYLKWFVFEAPFVGYSGEFEVSAVKSALSEQMRSRKGRLTIQIVSHETGEHKESFTYE